MNLIIIGGIVLVLIYILIKINFADSNVPVPLRIIISTIILGTLGAGAYYLLAPGEPSSVQEVAKIAKKDADTSFDVNVPEVITDTLSIPSKVAEEVAALMPPTKKVAVAKAQEPINKITAPVDTPAIKQQITLPKPDTISIVKKSNNASVKMTPVGFDDSIDTAGTGRPTYRLKGKSFFYTSSNEFNRSTNFIDYSAGILLTPMTERNGFIYVKSRNNKGKTSEGWLKQSDLELVNE